MFLDQSLLKQETFNRAQASDRSIDLFELCYLFIKLPSVFLRNLHTSSFAVSIEMVEVDEDAFPLERFTQFLREECGHMKLDEDQGYQDWLISIPFEIWSRS